MLKTLKTLFLKKSHLSETFYLLFHLNKSLDRNGVEEIQNNVIKNV